MIVADVKPANLDKMTNWMVEGKLKVVMDQVFPMEQVVEAYQKQKTGRVVGKIVIDVAGESEGAVVAA